MAVSNDSKFIISGSKDKSVKIFDVQRRCQIHHFPELHKGILITLSLRSLDLNFCNQKESIQSPYHGAIISLCLDQQTNQ